jgi:hypothetical protein
MIHPAFEIQVSSGLLTPNSGFGITCDLNALGRPERDFAGSEGPGRAEAPGGAEPIDLCRRHVLVPQ